MVEPKRLKIAVLFDGGGLARLGLELAGHDCTGYELHPVKHHLSKMVGSGNSILADVRDVDLSGYDAVWASPPCQQYSVAFTCGENTSQYADKLYDWSMNLPHEILWVENVIGAGRGIRWNAAQFEQQPRQNRNRVIGGRYRMPSTFRDNYNVPDICPAIMATEYKGCSTDKRRASRYYGRKITIREAAYHQGFTIPEGIINNWFYPMPGFTLGQWRNQLYETIGNGVPVYMAYRFGLAYSKPDEGTRQLKLAL